MLSVKTICNTLNSAKVFRNENNFIKTESAILQNSRFLIFITISCQSILSKTFKDGALTL